MQADKARRVAWGAALLLLLATMLGGCAREPAEQRLRSRIAAMEAAVEGRDADAFMDGIADNFIGDRGLDRQGLRRMLALQMLRNASISAVLGPLDISIEGDQARVRFELVLTGGAGGLVPERAQSLQVDTGWRDGPDDWQVVTAEWDRRF